MITATEAALTTLQWEALRDELHDPSFSVEIEQYSLSLASHDSSGHGSAIDNFDAIVCDDTVVRAWRSGANNISVQTLATEDGGDQAWSATAVLNAVNVDTGVPVSLATDGATNVRIFWWDGTNIKYFSNAAKGVGNAASWGAITQCVAAADVQFLGATALARCHFVDSTSSNNYQLHVVIDDGGWATTDSEVYWQTLPDSFDAVAGPQADDGASATNDIIVMATNFPQIISRKLVNTTLTYEISEVQGIAFLRYQNGRWSDHYEFDVIDEAPTFPSRYSVKIWSDGTWLFLTYYRKDGTATYSHTAMALSRSKDGIHWELPYLMTANLGDPAILVVRGNHAYCINSWKTYRSPMVGYTGGAATSQDITDYCMNVATQAGDIQKLSLTLANPEQALDSTSPLMDDVVNQARLKLGYWVSGTERIVQTGLFDVETIGGSQQLPADHVQVEGRDALGRLTSIHADVVNEFDSHQIGGDDFESTDETEYSGLRHTAPQQGSFKAKSNELYLVGNQQVGIAFNTFLSDAWNGSAQAGLKVAATDSQDYGGLIFRAHDLENFMSARYDAEDDMIGLYDRREGKENRIAVTAAMSWSVDTWYWLKVRFRYGYVWIYSSTDGITWTERIATEVQGVASGVAWTWTNFTLYNLPHMSGRCGYVGHGYSDEDDSYDPPPPAAILPEPPIPGLYHQLIVGSWGGGVAFTSLDSAMSGVPSWQAMNNGLTVTGSQVINDLVIQESARRLWACTNCGIYRASLPCRSTRAWTKVLTFGDVVSRLGTTGSVEFYNLAISWIDGNKQWCALTNIVAGVGFNYVAYTTDSWATFSMSALFSSGAGTALNGWVDIARHSSDQTLWCTHNRGVFVGGLYKSTNGGASFSLVHNSGGWHTKCVVVPNGSATDQYVFYTSSDDQDVYKSTDGGATFSAGELIVNRPQHIRYRRDTVKMYIPHWAGMEEYNETTGNFDVWKAILAPVAYDALVTEWGSGNTIVTTVIAGSDGGIPAGADIYRHTTGAAVDISGNIQTVLGGATGHLRVIAQEGGLVE
jgi:nuclear transport factor 2 (NTF2) superfamily protein